MKPERGGEGRKGRAMVVTWKVGRVTVAVIGRARSKVKECKATAIVLDIGRGPCEGRVVKSGNIRVR